nr:DUF3035 domain-containing protein [Govania unica]
MPQWGSLTIIFGSVALALSLGGCSSLGNALGFSKRPPDEYEIVSKAPLVVPPDYGLRPPSESEMGLKERNPRDLAYRAIFPPKGGATAMPALPAGKVGSAPLPEKGNFSEGVTGDAPKK